MNKYYHIIITLNSSIQATPEVQSKFATQFMYYAQQNNIQVHNFIYEGDSSKYPNQYHPHFHILVSINVYYELDTKFEGFKRICGRLIQNVSQIKVKKTFTFINVQPIEGEKHLVNTMDYLNPNKKKCTNLL